MKKFLKVLFWIVLVLVLIQFVPVDRVNPPIDRASTFKNVIKPPEVVHDLLKTSCYDCHSFETKYSDYAYVAPLSWAIKNHINQGREHLNFSKWGSYNPDQKEYILKKIVEQVQTSAMPLPSYLPYHPEARLNDAERKTLVDYFQKVLDSGKY